MPSNFESFSVFEFIRTSPTHTGKVRSMFEKAATRSMLIREWDVDELISACLVRSSVREMRVSQLACYAMTDMEETRDAYSLSHIRWGQVVSMLEENWGMTTSEEDTHGYEDS